MLGGPSTNVSQVPRGPMLVLKRLPPKLLGGYFGVTQSGSPPDFRTVIVVVCFFSSFFGDASFFPLAIFQPPSICVPTKGSESGAQDPAVNSIAGFDSI